MQRRRHRVSRITVGLWLIATALLVLVLVGVARGGSPPDSHRHCTHGVSSIGPMVITNGNAVSGSTTPSTEACLH